MDKLPQTPETYDRIFAGGGQDGVYDLPYQRSLYYPLFAAVHRHLRRMNYPAVLEVGCGPGGFAHLMWDQGARNYVGFDFSSVAVEKARSIVPGQKFFVGDAMKPETYAGIVYEAVVCTEVLEHIPDDRGAIAQWRTGATCICSVPNFDADVHVRHFRTEREVTDRYSDLIAIESVERVKRPALHDLSLRHRLRALRWARYKPREWLPLMGVTDFDEDGGWFIFLGKKR